MGRARRPAYCRCGLPYSGDEHCGVHRAFCPVLWRRVRSRHSLHPASDQERTGSQTGRRTRDSGKPADFCGARRGPVSRERGHRVATGGVIPMESYLAVVWGLLLGLAIVMYVILDGFDLGIGILFPTTRIEAERDQMMNTIAPFWDGNETWLVLGGGGLLVAFPLAYSILMPALHVPILVMLLGLVLRGVAFEFRWVAKPHHRWWDRAFFWGSLIAAFSQGCVLGGIVQGVKVDNNEFAGGSLDWLTPFSLFCGAAIVAGYALLGACWLNLKTTGLLQDRGR